MKLDEAARMEVAKEKAILKARKKITEPQIGEKLLDRLIGVGEKTLEGSSIDDFVKVALYSGIGYLGWKLGGIVPAVEAMVGLRLCTAPNVVAAGVGIGLVGSTFLATKKRLEVEQFYERQNVRWESFQQEKEAWLRDFWEKHGRDATFSERMAWMESRGTPANPDTTRGFFDMIASAFMMRPYP